ncbi:MAG: O-antigen ligase family protein [Thermovirgaceae bacterium]|nr:O-antigen ligase family protein [Thermovirgaceae bacterium]
MNSSDIFSRKNGQQIGRDHSADTHASDMLVPEPFLFGFLFISLVLPNIVFSGLFWFESLHLMKWVTAFLPIGILVAIAGLRIIFLKEVRKSFVLDPFGAVWLFLALLLLLQPLWAPITSWTTFAREWFFFAALWGLYVVARCGLEGKLLPIFLWGASVNAALNVIFAELQIRGAQGIFPLIYPTPGNYIGNTGQQNMFGLWLAIAMFGSAWIFIRSGAGEPKKPLTRVLSILNLLLFSTNAWGIWNSTSRSAVISLLAGLGVLVFLEGRRSGWSSVFRRSAVLAAILAVTFSGTIFFARGNSFVMKTRDMIENFQTVGNRDSIWATAGTMFTMHPVTGVGLGHFKWNYLDAQREMLRHFPDMKWQYTYWAHNEILQWFCETGIIGGLILLAMGAWWLLAFFRRMKSGEGISPEAVWACGFLFLIWFNALWTRPFHRIENAVWLPLAFAIANRDILPPRAAWTEIRRPWILRGLGIAMCTAATAGVMFLVSGMIGDRDMRVATLEKSPLMQRSFLESATRRLMVSDVAQRQMAYHYIGQAEKIKKVEYLVEGLTRLHLYFLRQPHSAELVRLLVWYSDVRETKLLESLAVYLKPGTYTIESGEIRFNSGDYINITGK